MTTIPFAVAGDSTTYRGSAWPNYLTDPDLVRSGGLAISGANSTEILAKIQPDSVAEVLVVMLGTNDISDRLTRAKTKENIEAIVAKVGAPRVVLAAIAPCDVTAYGSPAIDRQNLGFALNRDLSQLAADHGWLFADPWSSVRLRSNGWKDGADEDKVHPTAATSEAYTGPRMSVYIRQAVEGAVA